MEVLKSESIEIIEPDWEALFYTLCLRVYDIDKHFSTNNRQALEKEISDTRKLIDMVQNQPRYIAGHQ